MAVLSVDPPYHFGWKIKDEPEGWEKPRWQEIDLDKRNTDIILYKDNQAIGWWKIIK